MPVHFNLLTLSIAISRGSISCFDFQLLLNYASHILSSTTCVGHLQTFIFFCLCISATFQLQFNWFIRNSSILCLSSVDDSIPSDLGISFFSTISYSFLGCLVIWFWKHQCLCPVLTRVSFSVTAIVWPSTSVSFHYWCPIAAMSNASATVNIETTYVGAAFSWDVGTSLGPSTKFRCRCSGLSHKFENDYLVCDFK